MHHHRGGGGGDRGRGKTPPDINHLHSIMVFNISYKTRKEELYRSFDNFGDIADVYIPRDKYGESRGFGFVRFYDRRDAEDAKSMDGHVIGGRRIGVQMAKYGRRHEQGGYSRGGGGYGGPRAMDRGGRGGYGGPRGMDYRRDRAPHGRGHGGRRSYSRSRSRSRDRNYNSRSRSRSRSRSGHYRRRYYSRSRSGSRSRHKDKDRKGGDSYRRRSFSRSRSRSPSHDRHRKAGDSGAVATTTTTTTMAAPAPVPVAPMKHEVNGGHVQAAPQAVQPPPPVQPPVTTAAM